MCAFNALSQMAAVGDDCGRGGYDSYALNSFALLMTYASNAEFRYCGYGRVHEHGRDGGVHCTVVAAGKLYGFAS